MEFKRCQNVIAGRRIRRNGTQSNFFLSAVVERDKHNGHEKYSFIGASGSSVGRASGLRNRSPGFETRTEHLVMGSNLT